MPNWPVCDCWPVYDLEKEWGNYALHNFPICVNDIKINNNKIKKATNKVRKFLELLYDSTILFIYYVMCKIPSWPIYRQEKKQENYVLHNFPVCVKQIKPITYNQIGLFIEYF